MAALVPEYTIEMLDALPEDRSVRYELLDGFLKVRDYLAAGTRLIWVVDPERRTVTTYRPGEPAKTLRSNDVLRGDPVLPGFARPVAALFGDD